MFAGHFGVAAAVKSKTPELPLWSLIVSSQLLDIAFIPFSLAGIERMEPVGDGGYGNMMIYAFYTHSLVGASITCPSCGRPCRKILGKEICDHYRCCRIQSLDSRPHRPSARYADSSRKCREFTITWFWSMGIRSC